MKFYRIGINNLAVDRAFYSDELIEIYNNSDIYLYRCTNDNNDIAVAFSDESPTLTDPVHFAILLASLSECGIQNLYEIVDNDNNTYMCLAPDVETAEASYLYDMEKNKDNIASIRMHRIC